MIEVRDVICMYHLSNDVIRHKRSIIICSHTLSIVSRWLWAAANWLKCVRTPFGRTHLNHNTYMHILDYNYITFVVPFVPSRLYFRCQILYKFLFCVTNRNGLPLWCSCSLSVNELWYHSIPANFNNSTPHVVLVSHMNILTTQTWPGNDQDAGWDCPIFSIITLTLKHCKREVWEVEKFIME